MANRRGYYDNGGEYDDRYYDNGYDVPYDDGSYGEAGYEDTWFEEDYAEDAPRTSPGRSGGSASGGRKKNGSGTRSSGRRKKRKKKQSAAPVALTVLLIVIMAGAFGMKLFLDKYSYSKTQADLNEYFSISDETDVPITWNDALSDIRAKEVNGTYYLSLEAVQDNLNGRFYYGIQNDEDDGGLILYCLPTEIVSTAVGSSDVTTSEGTETRSYAPSVRIGESVYLALDYVKEYTNFSWQAYSDPNRLVITSSWNEKTVATVNKDTQIRVSGGIKSDILTQVSEGSTVDVLEQMDTWSEVVSEDGFIGYVENKRLDNVRQEAAIPVTDYTEPEYALHQLGTKVNMAFHNVYSRAAAEDTLAEYMAPTKTVNVIAPTIFWVTSSDGTMSSMASQQYVDNAHAMGLKIWAVVDNFNSTELPDRSSFLDTLDKRTYLIGQLIREVTTYGYDGINVDFEEIDSAYGQDYIEFIRELSIECRRNGLTLSIDDYPAYEFNSYYNIAEQGVFADYVVIMGYDEHYAGSEEAGSVSSIGYVTDGITMACEKVDKSKVINAVPFYDRIWKTQNGQVTSEAYGMEETQEYIAAHGMTQTWNAESGQNYAETTEDGVLIQIWVEDTQSIQTKLDVMTAAGIAGVAEWKLDFDTPEVWDVIANYMAE